MGKFTGKLNILRTDGKVESFEWSERPTISECTLMRRADPTIAAIGYGDHATRAGQPDLSWIGNYTTMLFRKEKRARQGDCGTRKKGGCIMSNTFKTLCQSCGFKMMEAADFLAVSPNTVKSWWLGTRTCPDGVINDLRELFTLIDRAAAGNAAAAEESISAAIKERGSPPELIQIGPCDDHEAQSLGLPNVAAHAAMLRRVIERLPPEYAALIEIVPRGSTPEIVAAADAHGK